MSVYLSESNWNTIIHHCCYVACSVTLAIPFFGLWPCYCREGSYTEVASEVPPYAARQAHSFMLIAACWLNLSGEEIQRRMGGDLNLAGHVTRVLKNCPPWSISLYLFWVICADLFYLALFLWNNSRSCKYPAFQQTSFGFDHGRQKWLNFTS